MAQPFTISQTAVNGYIAAVGAAGGVAYFITVLWPDRKKAAIAAAIVTLIIALGAVAVIDYYVNQTPTQE